MKQLAFILVVTLLIGCSKQREPQTVEGPKSGSTPQAQTIDPQKPLAAIDSTRTFANPDTSKADAPRQPKRPPGSPLKNKRWTLYELNGEAVKKSEGFRSDPYITLSVQSDKITGSGGCNRFGGKYVLEGEKLTFGPMSQTKMYCAEAMKVEGDLLRALADANGFKMKGEDTLALTSNGRTTARFFALYLY